MMRKVELIDIGRSMTWLFAAAVLLCVSAFPVAAQQEIGVDIFGSQSAGVVRLSVPFPALKGGVAAQAIHTPFFSPLTRDLAFSEIFALIPLPPNTSPTLEVAKRAGAQAFLTLEISLEANEYVIEARLYDVATKSVQLGRRYRGTGGALTRIAHMIASDLVRYFNGRPGIFLTQVAYVSNASGQKEIWLMDYDGSNKRRITSHGSIALSPDWSPDGEQLVYTAFNPRGSDLYLVSRRGGGRIRIQTGVNLNTAPRFSPDGRDIAFVGSIAGNPDIYLIAADGSNRRRITSASSIESTPGWSPTGRQIAFTSGRAGSPQIYVMDAEGTNVRRISYDGDWNDDPSFSPDGELLAYTSRVAGRFQIRIMNLTTQESRIIAGEGSNEQPAWSPDGKWLLFTSNRSGRWQIYRVGVDGRDLMQLTTEGDNTAPRWSNLPR
ncbi:MAG TPA: Tol-Pal system beta propeller repeat protein TolB [Thermoanaerobaculia bacterium]|nr:Tol-Pal system beta propeller repeat protein TolB [Thermoanaerobaculia bacterium]